MKIVLKDVDIGKGLPGTRKRHCLFRTATNWKKTIVWLAYLGSGLYIHNGHIYSTNTTVGDGNDFVGESVIYL